MYFKFHTHKKIKLDCFQKLSCWHYLLSACHHQTDYSLKNYAVRCKFQPLLLLSFDHCEIGIALYRVKHGPAQSAQTNINTTFIT